MSIKSPYSDRIYFRGSPGIQWGVVCALLAGSLAGCDFGRRSQLPTAHKPTQTSTTSTVPISTATDWFEDRTADSGIRFNYESGRDSRRYTILETVGGGLGLFDYDLDGRADLFCVGGGRIDSRTSVPSGVPCGLFQNRSAGKFAEVTDRSIVNVAIGYSHGCTAGDLNNDGFPDLLVTCYGTNCLLINQGDGTFRDATERSGLALATWNTAAAFGDIDRDGNLDIFICGYVDWTPDSKVLPPKDAKGQPDIPGPQSFSPLADHLLVSQGDGSFRDCSKEAGIRDDGMGLGVVAADINGDGLLDFYVANDVVANHLYWGQSSLPLHEAGEIAGVAYNDSGTPEGSMGIDATDVNGDGRIDLWVTNFEMEDNSLYVNLGDRSLQHSTAAFGLAGSTRPYVKFGTGFCDFDADGWPDLYVLSGHVRYHTGIRPFEQPSFLYQNAKGTRFEELTTDAGNWFRSPHAARGGAVGDVDDDGAPDLLISSLNEPVVLLHNRKPAANWVRLNLIGTRSPRTPIGAVVRFRAFDRSTLKPLVSGSGYFSQSDSRQLVALPASAMGLDLVVDWPSGYHEKFTVTSTRHDEVLVEGKGQPSKDDQEQRLP